MTAQGWRRDPAPAAPAPRSVRDQFDAWRDGGGPIALMLCGLLFAAQMAWAGEGYRLEFLFSGLFALLLIGLMAFRPWVRDALGFSDPWLIAGVVFYLAVLAVGLLSLTPFLPGGGHPIWSYVRAAPAVTLGRSGTWAAIVTLAGLGCAFLTGLVVGRRDGTAERFMSLVVPAFALFAFWSLATFTTDPQTLWGQVKVAAPDRLAGAYSTANAAALVLGIGLILALADLLRVLRRHGGVKGVMRAPDSALPRLAPGLAAILLCGAALALTQSRGGAAATLVGLLGLIGLEAQTGREGKGVRTGLIAGAAVLGLLAAFALYRPELFGRLMNAGADFETRRAILAAHWKAFLASPWSGYGLGSFDRLNNLILNQGNYPQTWNVRAAHNVVLQWLVSGGLIGALPMFACIGCLLWVLVRGLGRRLRMTGWLRAILCVSLAVLIASLTDYGLEEPAIALLWAVLLGLGAGLAAR
jgi:O-antigen ligase